MRFCEFENLNMIINSDVNLNNQVLSSQKRKYLWGTDVRKRTQLPNLYMYSSSNNSVPMIGTTALSKNLKS